MERKWSVTYNQVLKERLICVKFVYICIIVLFSLLLKAMDIKYLLSFKKYQISKLKGYQQ